MDRKVTVPVISGVKQTPDIIATSLDELGDLPTNAITATTGQKVRIYAMVGPDRVLCEMADETTVA